MPDPASLRAHFREHAENRPGVYQMFGPDGESLYVGKSIRVRTRVLAYFRATEGEKAHELIHSTARITWEYVPDEFGALVREMRLIQRQRPRFNVQHKRKRAWAFVKVTREAAPRLVPVRRVVPDGSSYFGPFPAVGRTALTVRELAHSVGVRDCAARIPTHFSDQPDLFAHERVPACLRGEIGSCLAPCGGGCSSAEYDARIRVALEFLSGQSDAPVVAVESAMAEAASRMEFEYAQVLRDRAARLRRFQEELAAFRGEIEDLSFAYPVRGHEGKDRVYLIRRGRVRAVVPRPRRTRERLAAARRVAEVFDAPDHGPAGLEPDEAAEILLVARWFRLHPEERERVLDPARWARELEGEAVSPSVPSSRAGRTRRRGPEKRTTASA